MKTEPALFIPLKKEWFEKFASGEKKTEYRIYGKRWNERVCRVGRRVVLSLGYGKKARLTGTITAFNIVSYLGIPQPERSFFAQTLLAWQYYEPFAAITIKLDEK